MMENETPAVARLINHFRRLPGVGIKTAQRYAYAVIGLDEADVRTFCDDMLEAKQKTKFCSVCGAYSESEECEICRKRDNGIICVVAEAKDVLSLERLPDYRGVYHVLGGVLSPLKGVGPDDLSIKKLLARVGKGGVEEVVMATNPDVEGDATAYYLARLLKPLGVKVTRLAQGVSIGSDLEYADDVTLSRALQNRSEL